jgi:hypothetical protein
MGRTLPSPCHAAAGGRQPPRHRIERHGGPGGRAARAVEIIRPTPPFACSTRATPGAFAAAFRLATQSRPASQFRRRRPSCLSRERGSRIKSPFRLQACVSMRSLLRHHRCVLNGTHARLGVLLPPCPGAGVPLGDDTNTQLSRDANDPNATSSHQSTLWASKALAASGQNRLLPRACTIF